MAHPNLILPHFSVYPKRKTAQNSDADIYLRINYQFSQLEKSLGIKIDYEKWDSSNHQVTNSPVHNLKLIEKTNEYKQKVMGAFYMLTQHGGEFTLREIVDTAFPNASGRTYSLFGVFERQILNMEKVALVQDSKANIGKHQSCLKHLKNFVKLNYKVNDVGFNRINRNFIDEFEVYLRHNVGNNHNSAMKMIQIFKKIYRIAVDNRWTAGNAFVGRKISFTDVEMPYLTTEEINKVFIYPFQISRLANTRNLFIFCCYTGLSYIDIRTLKRKHLEYSVMNNRYFIKKKRQKTKQPFIVPLLPIAKNILDTFVEGWVNFENEKLLFDVLSNQKYNAYLKEIAAFCGIQKTLTSHMARHSFATSIILESGVSLESTSKMLGHAKLSQTQKYAKVTELKIEKETRHLFNQL